MSATPTRDRRTERHQAARAEILDAAASLIREEGVAALSLRDLGERVGMRAQSLYSYFDSKEAIYDALFAQGAEECLRRTQALEPTADPRADFRRGCRVFVDFCLEDAARYQLLFQRTIPGFEPSPESYRPAIETLALSTARLAAAGGTQPEDLDLMTGMVSGLVDQQIANDPGGDRWSRLLDDALDLLFVRFDDRVDSNPKGAPS